MKAGEARSGFWEMKRATTPAMKGDWKGRAEREASSASSSSSSVESLERETHGLRGSRVDDVGVSDSSGENGSSRSGERDGEAGGERDRISESRDEDERNELVFSLVVPLGPVAANSARETTSSRVGEVDVTGGEA